MSEIVWTGENGREVAEFIGLDLERPDRWPVVPRISLLGPGYDESGETVVAAPGDTIVREREGRVPDGRFSVRKAS